MVGLAPRLKVIASVEAETKAPSISWLNGCIRLKVIASVEAETRSAAWEIFKPVSASRSLLPWRLRR